MNYSAAPSADVHTFGAPIKLNIFVEGTFKDGALLEDVPEECIAQLSER